MPTGYDIWGVVASVIGFLSIFQITLALINSRLPLKRLQVLEEALRDTEALLASVEEEGLFEDRGVYVSQVTRQVSNICKRVKRIRTDAFAAKTYTDELKQWWSGLSNEISVCYKEVRQLRANISTTSSEARKALAQRYVESERHTLELDETGLSQKDTTINESSSEFSASGAVFIDDGKTKSAMGNSQSEITTRPSDCHLVGLEMDGMTLEGYNQPESLEKTTSDVSPSGLGPRGLIIVPPEDTSPLSDSTDSLPFYRRQSSLPPYPSTPALTTTVFPRFAATSADAARATRKLVRAYRRNLMVHNVPRQYPGAQYPRHHAPISAAAAARAIDRPSNSTRHWKLLEQRARATLRPYVAVFAHEATSFTSPHADVGIVGACRCNCGEGVQQLAA